MLRASQPQPHYNGPVKPVNLPTQNVVGGCTSSLHDLLEYHVLKQLLKCINKFQERMRF